MRDRIPQFFEEWRFHWRALRFHRHAEKRARANRIEKKVATASALATALEHEIEQRELSGAARCRSVVFTAGPQTGAGIDRALYEQRKNPARRVCRGCNASPRRRERALSLGRNTGWPNELANVRSHAERAEHCHHSGKRLWRAGRRFLPSLSV